MEEICSIQKITASCFLKRSDHNNYLLVGSGSFIDLYVCISGIWEKSQSREVLNQRVIHGFTPGRDMRVAVHGQKVITVIQIEDTQMENGLSHPRFNTIWPPIDYDDWILDVLWFSEGSRFASITAHNAVLISDSITGNILSSHKCTINSILYSATLLYANTGLTVHQSSDVAVAGGTVFNKVVIWSCADEGVAPVLHELSGHKGVIFGISICYEQRLIASVSDDRSVHLWRYTPSHSTQLWSQTQFVVEKVFNGHHARVWRSVILPNTLVSVGEDSYLIIWNLDGSIRRKVKAFKGKSIWSLAVADNHLLTGGGDGGVKVWDLRQLLMQNSPETVESPSFSSHNHSVLSRLSGSDFSRSVALCRDVCLELTDQGNLYGHTLSKKCVRLILSDCHFGGYSVMAAQEYDEKVFVAIGNCDGVLLLVTLSQSERVHPPIRFTEGRLMSIQWLPCTASALLYLLLTFETGTMLLIEVSQYGEESVETHTRHMLTLPESKQRFIVSACLISEQTPHILACADKSGSLHIYVLQEESLLRILSPEQSLPRLHGKAGITDICYHDNYLYTSGRDGIYRQFSLERGLLTLQNEHKVVKGFEWLSKIIFDCDGNLKIGGFHTTEFILHDLCLDQTIMRIDCGGGYRNWGLTTDEHLFRFAYIKDRVCHLVENDMPKICTQLAPSFHGSKITGSELLWVDDRLLLITCSDDTTVKLSHIEHRDDRLEWLYPCASLTYHLSSVKCFCTVRSALIPSTYLVITGGGRAQLVICSIAAEANGTTLTKHMAVAFFVENYFSKRKSYRSGADEAETRIMAVKCVPMSPPHFLVCAACSDGRLRFITFNEELSKFDFTRICSFEHTHCLLSLDMLMCNQTLVCGTTDGTIMVFCLKNVIDYLSQQVHNSTDLPKKFETDLIKPSSVIQTHQSGVNVIRSFFCSEDNKMIIYSGGDDCCVTVMTLDLSTFSVVDLLKYPQQHAAQVTGLEVVDEKSFVTGSVDQRIYLWTREGNGLAWSVKAVKLSTVADISSLSYLLTKWGRLLAVAGEGLQLYKVRSL